MFWDRVAGVYDIFVNIINAKAHRSLRKIVGACISPGDEVLECACGTGLLTSEIAGRCKAFTATDFSEKMLEKARKNCSAYGNITFEYADTQYLKEKSGTLWLPVLLHGLLDYSSVLSY